MDKESTVNILFFGYNSRRTRVDIGGSRGWCVCGGGGWSRPTPGKSQVAIRFLKNSATDPPQEAIGPIGANCFSREVLCEIR